MGEDKNGRPIVLFGVWGISRKVVWVGGCGWCGWVGVGVWGWGRGGGTGDQCSTDGMYSSGYSGSKSGVQLATAIVPRHFAAACTLVAFCLLLVLNPLLPAGATPVAARCARYSCRPVLSAPTGGRTSAHHASHTQSAPPRRMLITRCVVGAWLPVCLAACVCECVHGCASACTGARLRAWRLAWLHACLGGCMRACMRAWLHLLNRTLSPTPPPTPIPTHSPRQMDLADMGAHANLGGFRYLLIVIDLHTKFMWIRVLKKKEAKPIAAKVRRNACSCRCPPLPNSVLRCIVC